MPDLDITIVEESTERVSKNLSYIHTRRRTITIEDQPTQQTSSGTSTLAKSATAAREAPPVKARAVSFADRRGEQLISRTVTTAKLPPLRCPLQSHVQIWSNAANERQLNYLIHIKGFKEKKEPRLVYERRSI